MSLDKIGSLLDVWPSWELALPCSDKDAKQSVGTKVSFRYGDSLEPSLSITSKWPRQALRSWLSTKRFESLCFLMFKLESADLGDITSFR